MKLCAHHGRVNTCGGHGSASMLAPKPEDDGDEVYLGDDLKISITLVSKAFSSS